MGDFREPSDFSTFPSEKPLVTKVQIETVRVFLLAQEAEFSRVILRVITWRNKSLAVETAVPASFSAMHLKSPESSGNASVIIKVHTSSGKGREIHLEQSI